MTFGERLKALRIDHELTQAEFGKRIGISRSAVGMYEQGKREPDFETLEKIADFFNVSLDYLQTGKRTEYDIQYIKPIEFPESFYRRYTERITNLLPQTDTETALLTAFRKADATTQGIILKILGIE